jgi:hypothetical protein
MANELTVSHTLLFAKGSKRVSVNRGSFQQDVAGNDFFQGTQIVTTSEAALSNGNITVPGRVVIRNLSSTSAEIVHVRAATGGANMVQIDPGCEESFKFSSTATAPFVISATGSPEIEITLIEA